MGRGNDHATEQATLQVNGFCRGSTTQPALDVLDVLDGTVLEIRDVPRRAVDFDDRRVTLVDHRVDLDALLVERLRLRARLTRADSNSADVRLHGTTADPWVAPKRGGRGPRRTGPSPPATGLRAQPANHLIMYSMPYAAALRPGRALPHRSGDRTVDRATPEIQHHRWPAGCVSEVSQ
ncbi:hypothetical protein ACW14Y_04880 [Kitasatospora sp. cg17-2]